MTTLDPMEYGQMLFSFLEERGIKCSIRTKAEIYDLTWGKADVSGMHITVDFFGVYPKFSFYSKGNTRYAQDTYNAVMEVVNGTHPSTFIATWDKNEKFITAVDKPKIGDFELADQWVQDMVNEALGDE
jgi:hypothetical protein